MSLLLITLVCILLIVNFTCTSSAIERFWIPSSPESIIGCPLDVPYRYTRGGLSYRLIPEHSSGLPTRADVLDTLGCNTRGVLGKSCDQSLTFPGTSILRKPHRAGVGVDTTDKLSGRFIDGALLNFGRWKDYKLDDFHSSDPPKQWYQL